MSGIITAKDLCLWYGTAQALKNICITIPENDITALIGPSVRSKFDEQLSLLNRELLQTGALWEGYAPENVSHICEMTAETIQMVTGSAEWVIFAVTGAHPGMAL